MGNNQSSNDFLSVVETSAELPFQILGGLGQTASSGLDLLSDLPDLIFALIIMAIVGGVIYSAVQLKQLL